MHLPGAARSHLIVEKSHRLALKDGPRIHHLRSAGDPLFSSAAKVYGPRVIAVVLTGSDSDGAIGAVDVKRAGGTVIAQDRTTSKSFGMPQAAIATGCVDAVLPIEEIGPWLTRATGDGRLAKSRKAGAMKARKTAHAAF